jgi:hypothetical protein
LGVGRPSNLSLLSSPRGWRRTPRATQIRGIRGIRGLFSALPSLRSSAPARGEDQEARHDWI